MNALPTDAGVMPGLTDPVLDSQRLFRTVLDAMAHPGAIVDLTVRLSPPPPLDIATAAAALALADFETPLWMDLPTAAGSYFRFHCGSALAVRPDEAVFAIITAPEAMPPLGEFQAGSDEYPDRSTTLIIQVPALTGGTAWILRGPGIEDSQRFAPAGLPDAFAAWVRDNHVLFPRGVDLIFTCGSSLAAMPRSTRLDI